MKTKPIVLLLNLTLFTLAAGLRLVAQPAPQFVTIYQFGGINAIPGAGLTVGPGGKLFGTTYGGAASDGTGSVFELAPNGNGTFVFNTLYRFDTAYSPPNDGQYPYAGVTLSHDGTALFGTTQMGGTNSAGIVFRLNIAKAEGKSNVIPAFGIFDSYLDLLDFIDFLYGGAPASDFDETEDPDTGDEELFEELPYGGSADNDGTLDRIEINNNNVATANKVHTFSASPNDGAKPAGSLTMVQNGGSPAPLQKLGPKPALNFSAITLYGVTSSGGSNNVGTVYKVNANGSNFMVLHHFSFSATDGANPLGGMVLSGNTLYGTTSSGGRSYGGTIFKINTDGNGFQIITNFDYSTTGSSPQADLILSGDTLYGTTYIGGINGGGTVYSVKTNGSNLTMLHSFTSPMADSNGNYTNSDGGWLVARLTLSGNTLYGTTPYGGTNGVGTAFEIILPSPPLLHITPLSGNFKNSWPSFATNYILQINTNLATTNWSNVGLAVSNDGTNQSVIFAPPPASAFFRLINTNGP